MKMFLKWVKNGDENGDENWEESKYHGKIKMKTQSQWMVKMQIPTNTSSTHQDGMMILAYVYYSL